MHRFESFLQGVANLQSSFVLFGDRIYDVLDSSSYPDFVSTAGFKQGLKPSVSFADFEGFDSSLYAAAIHNDQHEYVSSRIDREIRSSDEESRQRSKLHALKFIMYDFLPLIVSKEEEGYELLEAELIDEEEGEDPVDITRNMIAARLQDEFGPKIVEGEEVDQVEELKAAILRKDRQDIIDEPLFSPDISLDDLGISPDSLSESFLGGVTSHQPLYVLGGKVYRLERVGRRKKDQIVFRINGRNFSPSDSNSVGLGDIVDRYESQMQLLWRIDALERSVDEFEGVRDLLKTGVIDDRIMFELAMRDAYDIDGTGFIFKSGKYWVYTTTPKFATQDGRNGKKYWPFPETRVAIPISSDGDIVRSSGKAILVDPNPNHPCISDRDSSFQGLCNLNRGDGSYGDSALEFLRKLSDAVNVVMEPLNKPSLDSHSGHTYFGTHLDNILKQSSLTRREAEEQGYFVRDVLAVEKKDLFRVGDDIKVVNGKHGDDVYEARGQIIELGDNTADVKLYYVPNADNGVDKPGKMGYETTVDLGNIALLNLHREEGLVGGIREGDDVTVFNAEGYPALKEGYRGEVLENNNGTLKINFDDLPAGVIPMLLDVNYQRVV